MNHFHSPLTVSRDDGSNREAPSAIINASQSLVRWHFLLGWVCLAVAVSLGWFILLSLQWDEAVSLLQGRQPIADGNTMLIIAGIAAFLPLLNAIVFFRSGSALRKFSHSRLIRDLHPAMCRLRAVWRTMSITVTILVLGSIAHLVLTFIGPRQ
jgi:hypothetical protein